MATGRLTTLFTGAQRKQAEEILADIGENVELQVIVKECVAQYKKEKEEADKVGCTVQDMVAAKQSSRKRKKEDDEDEETEDEEGTVEIDDKPLRRGQLIFANWSKRLIDIAFTYSDPLMTSQVLKLINKNGKIDDRVRIRLEGVRRRAGPCRHSRQAYVAPCHEALLRGPRQALPVH